MSALELRTAFEWGVIKGVTILDPDGWRRDRLPLTAPLCEEDFDARVGLSTVRPVTHRRVLIHNRARLVDTPDAAYNLDRGFTGGVARVDDIRRSKIFITDSLDPQAKFMSGFAYAMGLAVIVVGVATDVAEGLDGVVRVEDHVQASRALQTYVRIHR